ncbi:hypothetical protein SAMN05216464_10627 [Mucilaginibacter pineti]|uniref:Uncharacterized protein n=1 Tax=Mucilaginibacter pineti TaxID=1391627 RepID=A0A1G7CNL4_9SPHI|nr:hypothetical protein [Mucilaginibacter pineti]SDE40811.1 hypothetical protein SAMN05216464_10627 [Mucilaginibacter pineti]
MDAALKRIAIITILLVGLVVNLAKGQVYNLKSFKGDDIQIKLLLDKGILSIRFLKDTVCFRNVDNLKIMKVLNNNFLMIVYDARAGSGMHMVRTLILSANNNKICQSLNVTSFFKDEFLDFSKPHLTSPIEVEVKTVYNADLSLTGNNNQNYKLNGKVHGERKSVHEPKINYNYNDAASLHFDRNQNIFYNSHESIAQYFTIFDPKTQKEIKQYIKGTFPIAKLGRYKYYYIKNEWYERYDNDLSKYSFVGAPLP